MDENMNTEVSTEEIKVEGMDQNLSFESDLPSGPSKGFLIAVGGAITAAVVGGVVAFNRHKKKKVTRKQEVEILDDEDVEEDPEWPLKEEDVEDEVKKPETKPNKKK